MPITLGINIQSLASQKRLADASEASGRIFERLSSGLRINRASDDAAGLAISESLRTDARVYSQGIRNFNDGISLLTMADAAIEQLIGITIRIAELAEQSANGTYGVEQRKASDAEAQALSKEFFRISRSTEFNGIGLFDGELSQLTVQGGYGSDGMISSSIGGALGTGEFQTARSYALAGGSYTTGVTTGDFNGDGVLDVATAGTLLNTVGILLGRGDGSLSSSTSYPTGSGGTEPRAIDTGDFNRDGILDLVTANSLSNSISVLTGRGDGSFSSAQSYPNGTMTPYDVQDVSIGDFNGDGILDLATAEATSNTVGILIGRGDGTFNPRKSFASQGDAGALTTGDFNNDGILDIATHNKTTNSVDILRGVGDGTLQYATSFSAGASGNASSISTADFNGDGFLDLVTANSDGDSATVMLGDGNLNFNALSYATGTQPLGISTGDFNGDGIIDFATADGDSDTISILVGRGDGTFNSATSYQAGDTPAALATGDFNGDGVVDLVSANYDSFTASILLGTTREGINPLLSFSLKTMADAKQALSMIQKKREQLSSQRGAVGALQARLTVGVSTLTTKNENYLAAASRVRDIDVAQDAAEAVRLRILKETGAAILSQANQLPTLALSLLR